MKGTLVQCIDYFDLEKAKRFDIKLPQYGKLYTIREVEEWNGAKYYRFEEILNAEKLYTNGFLEPSFNEDGFKLLQSGEEGNNILNQINQILCSH